MLKAIIVPSCLGQFAAKNVEVAKAARDDHAALRSVLPMDKCLVFRLRFVRRMVDVLERWRMIWVLKKIHFALK